MFVAGDSAGILPIFVQNSNKLPGMGRCVVEVLGRFQAVGRSAILPFSRVFFTKSCKAIAR